MGYRSRNFQRSFQRKRKAYMRKYPRRKRKRRFRIPQAISQNKLIKMKYGQSILRTPLSTADSYVFRSNSIFDPDLTGTGHQPMSHDQWATFYERYYVYACAVKITVVNLTAIPLEFVLYPQEDTTTITTLDLAMEMKNKKFTVVPGSAGNAVKSLSMWTSTKKTVGRVTKFDDIFHANFGANPNTTTQYHIFVSASDDATDVNYTIDAQLTYYVKMYRPVTFASS